MGFKLLFVFVALYCHTSAYRSIQNLPDYSDSEEYYDSKSSSSEEQKKVLINTEKPNEESEKSEKTEKTEKPQPRYEVTENVIDIPNNEIFVGPIFANFTISRPLNNATMVRNVTLNKVTVDATEANKRDSTFDADTENVERIPSTHNSKLSKLSNIIPSIKDYVLGVKKGIVNGWNSITKKDTDNNVNGGVSVPNIVAAPVLLLNKIHKKTSDVANKIHGALFGKKFDED